MSNPDHATEPLRPRLEPPDDSFELAGGAREGRLIAGIDEVGRGAIAGPIVAAAVVLDLQRLPAGLQGRIRDSKLLTALQRRRLRDEISPFAEIGLGMVTPREIERLNVLRATLRAMGRAVRGLGHQPELVLVDGRDAPRVSCPVEPIVDGDRRCLSIAVASIVAKTERDRLMQAHARRYPGYGWEHNMGYATPEHLAALAALGPTPLHRRSFGPLHALLASED
jgi:ribonuclease HII